MAEQILHYASVTTRLNGSGLLRYTMRGLDSVKTLTLGPVTMATSPGIEPTRLMNFTGQRCLIRGETTAINEYMKINRIVLFAKPIYTQYPASMSA